MTAIHYQPKSARPATRPDRRQHRLPWFIALAGSLAATLLYPWSAPVPTPSPPGIAAATVPLAAPLAASPVAVAEAPLQRTELVVSATPTASSWTFDQFVDELVRLGAETSRLAAANDEDAAQQNDQQARTVFAELWRTIADADEQALARIAASAPPPRQAPTPQQLRWLVYTLCVDTGLQRRHQQFTATRDRQRLDHLTGAVLSLLPQDERLAGDFGRRRLVDQPYLGAAHEQAVLGLADLAGEGKFAADLATALLLTDWRNMVAEGVRTREDLCNRALVLLQATNQALRGAASQLLLGDARFREVVLDQLRQQQDPTLARQLAMAAASELPPADAIAVLHRLQSIGANLMPAFLTLGTRSAEVLCAAYEQTLADNVDAAFRAELVTGAGFSQTPGGVELAKLAFAADPSAEVRTRAMFALTANAADALGEATVSQMVEDAAARGDANQLGSAVLALENLERAGLINAVDRLGQRLRACPALRQGDRDNLERILARALPGGEGR